jgi:hypothetical protein
MAFLPGVPLLYNGQEVESPQKLPLFEKVAIEWDQPGARSAVAFYKRVIELARTHRAFQDGDIRHIDAYGSDDVIAYRRGDVLVFVNTRAKGIGITPRGIELVAPIRLLGEGYRVRNNGISLDPYGFVVLELSR